MARAYLPRHLHRSGDVNPGRGADSEAVACVQVDDRLRRTQRWPPGRSPSPSPKPSPSPNPNLSPPQPSLTVTVAYGEAVRGAVRSFGRGGIERLSAKRVAQAVQAQANPNPDLKPNLSPNAYSNA